MSINIFIPYKDINTNGIKYKWDIWETEDFINIPIYRTFGFGLIDLTLTLTFTFTFTFTYCCDSLLTDIIKQRYSSIVKLRYNNNNKIPITINIEDHIILLYRVSQKKVGLAIAAVFPSLLIEYLS